MPKDNDGFDKKNSSKQHQTRSTRQHRKITLLVDTHQQSIFENIRF